MTQQIDVVIIGGGQAGLALSYYLTQQGRAHVVLERGQVAETWRSQRWDSFTLVTPNWMTQLPGFPYQGEDPDSFLPRDDVVTFLERYARSFQAPVHCGVQSTAVRLRPEGNGYLVETNRDTYIASTVVLATGGFPRPKLPQASAAIPVNIMQLHSNQYRKPQRLPSGAVLVVGSGQSGSQIAEELHQSGRQVYLCISRCGRSPRRYRGKDIMWWINQMGGYDRTVDALPSPAARFACHPDLSGKDGGHEINLRQLAREGVVLLGRLQEVQGSRAILAPDLEKTLPGQIHSRRNSCRRLTTTCCERAWMCRGKHDRRFYIKVDATSGINPADRPVCSRHQHSHLGHGLPARLRMGACPGL
jgi:putative flavoprotein involved in K+ transport